MFKTECHRSKFRESRSTQQRVGESFFVSGKTSQDSPLPLISMGDAERMSRGDTDREIGASFDLQGRATRPVVDPRVSFRGAFLKAFRRLSRSTGCVRQSLVDLVG